MKQGGTAVWICVIVSMLALMGGLLYWKLGREKPLPPPAPSVVAAPSAEGPVFEAPPPPPPSDEPDSSKVAAAPAKKAGSGGCSGPCSGQVTPPLDGSLRAVARSAQACYERALRQNATLQGRLVVGVKVSPSGASCGANIVQNTLGDSSVTSCVLQKFRSATFLPPVGGCVDVQVPISFVAKAP